MYAFRNNLERPPLNSALTVWDFLSPDHVSLLHRTVARLSAGTITDPDQDPSRSTRSSDIAWIQPDKTDPGMMQIWQHIYQGINKINDDMFRFDLTDMEALQYTRYETGQYYSKHIDVANQAGPGDLQRKLSFSVQLSHDNDYQGGDLILYPSGDDGMIAERRRGTITLFASYTMHEVTPVTQGTRFSLVGWVWGPRFR